ncbi:MAG: hypothetical protein R3F20_17765 [Planctomycetota bacterium]
MPSSRRARRSGPTRSPARCSRSTPSARRTTIAGRLRRLLSWQLQGGESLPFGWSYPGEDPAALAPDAADLSNTQYAALGLWVASERRGLVVPDAVWLGLGRAVLRFQEVDPPGGGGTGYPPAGFGYRAGAEPTGSMTVAGVGILSLCRRALGRRAPGAWVVAEKRGLAWLAAHFSVVGNPGAKGAAAGGWSGYYRYGLERTATWCEEVRLGPYDWYGLGAWHLVETQRADGDWGNLEETIFAILFLSRATAQSTGRTRREPTDTWRTARDAPACEVVAQGRGPTALWIAGWTDALRESLAWPGEEAGGPRVARVVWEEFRDGRSWRELAEVAGDGGHPAGTERFATQVRLRGKGPWRVRARIEIAPPGARRRTIELRSGEVTIPTVPREDDVDRAAASRPLRRLPLLGWTLEADSRADARSAASRAGDGSDRTAWRARAGAVRPRITLRSPRPVTVAGLRISQPREHRLRLGPRAGAQALRVEITLDDGPPVEVAMPSDPVRPLEHVFIRPRPVREITVRIVDERPSEEGPGPGFAEIEVLVVD